MTQRNYLRLFAFFAASLAFGGCTTPDVVVTENTFKCIREMTPVRGFYVTNVLGNLDATLAVANSPAGKTYPPGSLLQVIPTSAMVKHQPGHNPQTNDWEFFELGIKASGATILGRGFEELNMRSGLNCLHCHEPAKASADLVCEQGGNCLPVPVTRVAMRGLQKTDPRCPKIEVPQDELDALAAMARGRAPPPATP